MQDEWTRISGRLAEVAALLAVLGPRDRARIAIASGSRAPIGDVTASEARWLDVRVHDPVMPVTGGAPPDDPRGDPRVILFPDDAEATFAILDGARIPGLPERLAAADADPRCLFRGAAAEEMGDSAPWVVRLERDADLTTALLTEGRAFWHGWGRADGLFLRAGGDIDSLCTHLRRFTRVRDDQGAWYFFRFWEPATALAFAASTEFSTLFAGFLAPQGGAGVTLVTQSGPRSMVSIRLADGAPERAAPPVLTLADRAVLRAHLDIRDAEALADFLGDVPVLGDEQRSRRLEIATRALRLRRDRAVRSPNEMAWLVILSYLSLRDGRAASLFRRMLDSRTWTVDQFARMLHRRLK